MKRIHRIRQAFQLSAAILLLAIFASNRGFAAAKEPSQGAPSPLTLSAYSQNLHQWISTLEALRKDPHHALALEDQLTAPWHVAAVQEQFTVSTDWLRAQLDIVGKNQKTSRATLETLIARLKALEREAERLEQPPERRDKAAPHLLEQILAQPEFNFQRPVKPNWLDRQIERFNQWLNKLFSRLNHNLTGHTTAVEVLFWILLAGAAGGFLVWMIRQLLARPRTLQFKLPEPAPSEALSWQGLIPQARFAAARGEYREAIRLAHRAAIIRLGTMGLWTVDDTRTHREYLRLLNPSQPARAPLETLTRQFELAWYAARPASEQEFQAAIAQLEKLG